MQKKDVLLPSFGIASIYSWNPLVHAVLMPIGVTYDKARQTFGKSHHDNENDEDSYKAFYLTSIEVVSKSHLPFFSRRRLSKDNNVNNGPLYLATMVHLDENGLLWERQVFVGKKQLKRLGFRRQIENGPIGDKKSVILMQEADWVTKGQYWGWSRPRLQRTLLRAANEETVATINSMLADPAAKIIRGPLPITWTPSRGAAIALAAVSFAGRILASKGLG